jgi:hypothetical protein
MQTKAYIQPVTAQQPTSSLYSNRAGMLKRLTELGFMADAYLASHSNMNQNISINQ